MTKTEAFEILIECGCRDYIGQGKGHRSTTDEWRVRVKEAVKIVFKHINKREPSPSELFNMGL